VVPGVSGFVAWVTTAMLGLVLVTGSAVVLTAQVMVFAIGAFAGLQLHPGGVARPENTLKTIRCERGKH
jgi:hypothetical protein